MRLPSCSSHFASRCTSSIKKSVYDPSKLEVKWQLKWQNGSASRPIDNGLGSREEKFYTLSMFPYPSGRLHMGHVRVYTYSDCIARFQRMMGRKVLHPMGWDAFGLPAENAAIDRGVDPAVWTYDNISSMRTQLHSLGLDFDWQREVYTCSPDYYKWTQWVFLQLYKHGLAYKKKALVNWDPVDQTVLANEQVDENGCSWRSGAKVEQRYLDQWFFKITHYAEALLSGLDELDWPQSVKLMQTNWIGRSKGAYFDFKFKEANLPDLRVFTTRPDTVFGVTFVAISPEHAVLQHCQLEPSVLEAIEMLKVNRNGDKSKQGVALGLNVVHPFTQDPIPVYAADYVIDDYGTSAVMGVPAHDQRDYQFALEQSILMKEGGPLIDVGGALIQPAPKEADMEAIIQDAKRRGCGGPMNQYKLRDWLISRQRYWGAPIPVMYCERCGVVPVPEDQLPVTLPQDVQFTGRGPSPLLCANTWLKANCGRPGCCAVRDTDTMDTFVDSSWYFLRYINPRDSDRPFSELDAGRWMPVDIYIGGIEHAILHLLYARFITYFLHDLGLVREREPFKKLLTQGMVQGKTFRERQTGRYLTPMEQRSVEEEGSEEVEVTWEKMSKSKYNGVEPNDIVLEYGADTVRLFMLFKAPPEAAIQWDIKAIQGVHRWLHRVWGLCADHVDACTSLQHSTSTEGRGALVSATQRAIKQVTLALQKKHTFNVAVAELMTLTNVLREHPAAMSSLEYHQALRTLCLLLSPMAPHITSELWEGLKEAGVILRTPESLQEGYVENTVFDNRWPSCVPHEQLDQDVEVVLQLNGRKKASVRLSVLLTQQPESLETEVLKKAYSLGLLDSRTLVKTIVAPHGKVVNFVTK